MRFLVTAGNTRERIDQVRDWGNIFTGNTGFAIAKALAGLGTVDLLTSNASHLAEVASSPQSNITGGAFGSHKDLVNALEVLMSSNRYDAVFMTAAVSDYTPAGAFAVVSRAPGTTAGEQVWTVRDVQAGKVSSTHREVAILGTPTSKIVDMFRRDWKHKGLLVKFKLEVGITTEALLEIGERSRLASGADFLVANTLEMVSGANPGAFLLGPSASEWVSRSQLPDRMARLVTEQR